MGFNPKKELLKIKDALKTKGYTRNIPIDVFSIEIMIHLGTGKRKTIEWISNYELMGLIRKENNLINFI
jgi:hypothetical protein